MTFKEKVLNVVRKIPKGKTMTYKEVASRAGSPNASRAVGNIMRKNFDRTVPCHRVVGSDLPAPRQDRFFAYVILCGNGAMYIGQTCDIQKRWQQHKDGKGAAYTKRYGVKALIHYEIFSAREKALLREKYLKTGFGRQWLKKEWEAGRTRQAGGKMHGYNRGGSEEKERILKREGALAT